VRFILPPEFAGYAVHARRQCPILFSDKSVLLRLLYHIANTDASKKTSFFKNSHGNNQSTQRARFNAENADVPPAFSLKF
jgi:hypothetical protein